MANNINIINGGNNQYNSAPAKVKGKVMRRFSMFDGTGVDLTTCNNYDEALLTSGLDYGARQEKLYLHDGTELPSNFAFVKSDDPTIILGVNGSQYTAVDNRTAFGVADELVQEGNFRYEVGGPSLGCQRTVDYAKAFLTLRGDDFTIGDDVYNSFVVFQNSFDGSSGVNFQVICQRLVCLNGLTRYLGSKKQQLRINIQHSRTAEDRIRIARDVIKQRVEDIEIIKKEAAAFIGTRMTKAEFQKEIIPLVLRQQKLVVDGQDRQRGQERIEQVVHQLCQAYEMDDTANYENSAYRIILALSDYETHGGVLKDTKNPSIYLNRALKGFAITTAVAQYIANTRHIVLK